jgi:phage baseplate assembly protein W
MSVTSNEVPFLGTGWRFPLRVDGNGGLAWSTGERAVYESIWMILSTSIGERPMRPRFGCGIHELVFESDSAPFRAGVADLVRNALTEWENRIDVIDVRVVPADPAAASSTVVHIYVDYRIRENNAFHNLVYPFYAVEGQGV